MAIQTDLTSEALKNLTSSAVLEHLESPGAIQEEAIEGLYNPHYLCLVLGIHILLIYYLEIQYYDIFSAVCGFFHFSRSPVALQNFLQYANITALSILHSLVSYF